MDDVLVVKKANVIAAASKCSQAKAVLVELFPEAFPRRFFNSGTMFIETDAINLYLYPAEVLEHIIDNLSSFSPNIWIITHLQNSKMYGLVNIWSGELWRMSEKHLILHRTGCGIEIPSDVLKKLTFVKNGTGSAKALKPYGV